MTVGAAAGRCSGVSGNTSCGASTGVLAVTITPLPVTQAMAPGAGVDPSVEHGACWATARRLEMQNRVTNAMDRGPKFIDAFQGEPEQPLRVSMESSLPRQEGRKRWYYDLRYRSTLNHYPVWTHDREACVALTHTIKSR